MKKAFGFLAAFVFVLCIYLVSAKDRSSFSVSDSNETYKITA
ncbi:hypothetical protein [Chitinophaga sp. SYP-B3965]|nr:hypothetical protein [Chitinophaga sp. SYP-B3965]